MMPLQPQTRGSACVPALLAGSLLIAGSVPAAAQSASATVVCVGSERQTLESSGPVRRVITEDVAVVYRLGVPIDDRQGMEQSLVAELGDVAEASCLWSNPGDSHVVIIRYTGAIRRDLTLDPDDPRFQAFAVGYGTSAQAAEENATRLDARFSTYADRSGYEVLVAESWVVSAGAVPGAASEPGTARLGQPDSRVGGSSSTAAPPSVDLETCAGKPVGSECWMEVANQPGCHLWNEGLHTGATVTWSGECFAGYAQGTGTVHWRYDDGQQTAQGAYIDGKGHGNWVIRFSDGDVAEGSYVIGEWQGIWTWWFSNGNVKESPYVNDELSGRAIECARDLGDVIAWIISYIEGEESSTETIGLRHPEAPTVRARCSVLLNKPRPWP
ncbi:MAG: hypothetical protein OXI39_09530 [Gemmatimonadota bacterium]|uniref:toxin-antitoxin system YwqK family antitoxin n=1 Tax=Candidatus Palauibacter scopulicola TaxID=3056741 RepID=UPI0023A61F81|nr:hypothetical protein [Candidatus Palauibacter scopulicola]MDE2663226.1 hypothetical protein [Candidatus Palauibacter scopulicola]